MRIGIVNDQTMAVEILRRTLAARPEHRVIWVAKNGAEAVELCAKDLPDLVLMDLLMPVMDGVEATRRIMAETPCLILVVTVSVGANASRAFEALGYGAYDAVDTPVFGSDDPRQSAAQFLAKIDRINALTARKGGTRARTSASGPLNAPAQALVAIGCSAGGPAALAKVLSGLPQDFGAAVIVIQHIDEQFAPGMAEWLAQHSRVPVRTAKAGMSPQIGTVLMAATGDHLTLTAGETLDYTPEPRDFAYRPSVDVFFRAAANLWRGEIVGVLLTGMGSDGALGLKELRDRGHYTIAQDKATSVVYGMPKAAAALEAAVDILPLQQIAPKLVDIFARKQLNRIGAK
jgi:two-component system, chemotaxis family, response regulator WspF